MTPPRQTTDISLPIDTITFTVTRPSIDVQPEQVEATTSTPAPSLLTIWLKENGVPSYNERLKKPTSDSKPESEGKSVTASNVTANELTVHLNWSFHRSIASVPSSQRDSCKRMLKSIEGLFKDVTSKERNLFSLPSEWSKEPKSQIGVASSKDNEPFWRQCLPEHRIVTFRPQKDIENSKFPEANIFDMYNEKLKGGGIASSLTNILAGPIFSDDPGARSEMDVERLHGSIVSSFFNLPECDTTSNISAIFKNEITCFGSHPKPDLMTRVKPNVQLTRPLHPELYPIVGLGEGKPGVEVRKPTHLEIKTVTTEGIRFPRQLPSIGAKLPMAPQLENRTDRKN